jgi:Uma2 family endonuclease
MAATTHLMTVEEFQGLPEDGGATYHELHHGELITLTRPKHKHARIQKRLERLLESAAGEQGTVIMELAFRPVPEYELRVADVAYVSQARWDAIDPEGNLQGAPEILIEILSPSNTAAEILDKEQICLANGAKEFWVVDPDRRRVKITTSEGRTMTYGAGQHVPVSLFGPAAQVSVDDVFRY